MTLKIIQHCCIARRQKIEVLANKLDYFSTRKRGSGYRFIIGKNIDEVDEHSERYFSDQLPKIKRIIRKFQKLTTGQSGKVASIEGYQNRYINQ